MKRITFALFAMGMTGLFAIPAVAAPVTFFGEDLGLGENTPLTSFPNSSAARSAFLTDLTNVGTQNFEGIATNTTAPLNLTFPGSSGSITATLEGNGYVATVTPGSTDGFGRYATSGSNFWQSSDVFTITFSSPVSAFGFYGIDIGDFNGQVTLTTAGGLNELFTIPSPLNTTGGGVLFFGLVDPTNSFTSISFGNTAAGTDYFGFDDMTIGDAGQIHVPEPATPAMLGLGLLALGFVRLRRRQTARQAA